MLWEEKKLKEKAQNPWPTKARLSKEKADFTDQEGRRYYLAFSVALGEEVRGWLATRMEAHPKGAFGTWCRLQPYGKRGNVPEEADKIVVETAGKETKTLTVLEASTIKYTKERGTAFVVFR